MRIHAKIGVKLSKLKRLRCKFLGHAWSNPVVTPFGVTEECSRCPKSRFTPVMESP